MAAPVKLMRTVPLVGNAAPPSTLAPAPYTTSGENIVSLPMPNGASGGFTNYTMILKIPAAQVLTSGQAVILTVLTGSNFGGGAFSLQQASIASTAPNILPSIVANNFAWTQGPNSVVFPSGSFTVPNTRYASAPCVIDINSTSDYYVMLWFDSLNTSNVPYFSTSGLTEWVYKAGYLGGNHCYDSDATLVASPTGTGIFGIVQLTIA
jgi:hypothetical protein